jgi:hypothetical protein
LRHPLQNRRFQVATLRPGGVSRREALAACGVIAALVAALYGSYVARGDFLYDDWEGLAHERFDPGLNPFGSRFLFSVYGRVVYDVFGSGSAAGYLATAAFLAGLGAFLLFILLRTVGIGTWPAIAVAVLTAASPFADSTRLWFAASPAQLAATLVLAGAIVALWGLQLNGRRAVVVHCVAVLLYVAAVLTYEAVTPLALAAGALYALRVPWRRARWWWGADVAVVAGAAALVVATTPKSSATPAEALRHVVEFAGQSVVITGRFGLQPEGAFPSTLLKSPLTIAVVILLAGVLAVGARLAVRLPGTDHRRAPLRQALALVAAGIVVVVVSYAALVPSRGYSPISSGIGNRTNVVAVIGFVLAFYGLIRIAAVAAAGRWASAVTAVACLALLGGYWARVRHDEGSYLASHRIERRVLRTVAARTPAPPPQTVVIGFGTPEETAPGVPVFTASYDLRAALQLTWGDRTIEALPEAATTAMDCAPDGVRVKMKVREETFGPAPYGSTRFVDLRSGRYSDIPAQRQCSRMLPQFRSGSRASIAR